MIASVLMVVLPLVFLYSLVVREPRWAAATLAGAVVLHPVWLTLLIPLVLQQLMLRWDPSEGAWLRSGDWMVLLPFAALLVG